MGDIDSETRTLEAPRRVRARCEGRNVLRMRPLVLYFWRWERGHFEHAPERRWAS